MSWNLPTPDHKFMARAWEKNPLAKRTVDRLATTDGLQAQVEEWVREYTPERNATHRALQMQDRLRREAQIYALWLEHLDEMERHRLAVAQRNEQAWEVLGKVLAARTAGRKTIKITDLIGEEDD